MPVMLPVVALLDSRRSIPACTVASSKVAEPIVETSSPMRPIATSIEIHRWPLIVSTSESEESTPTSMMTKRKSIMTAPV